MPSSDTQAAGDHADRQFPLSLVAIGASAGGLAACTKLLQNLPTPAWLS